MSARLAKTLAFRGIRRPGFGAQDWEKMGTAHPNKINHVARKTNLQLTINSRPNSFVHRTLRPPRLDIASPIERREKSRIVSAGLGDGESDPKSWQLPA
jgi:hypothetical protein